MVVPADPPVTPAFLQVVRGDPTAAELAAVVVVVGARASTTAHTTGTRPQRSLWAARAAMMRPPVMAGPGAWRASALP